MGASLLIFAYQREKQTPCIPLPRRTAMLVKLRYSARAYISGRHVWQSCGRIIYECLSVWRNEGSQQQILLLMYLCVHDAFSPKPSVAFGKTRNVSWTVFARSSVFYYVFALTRQELLFCTMKALWSYYLNDWLALYRFMLHILEAGGRC